MIAVYQLDAAGGPVTIREEAGAMNGNPIDPGAKILRHLPVKDHPYPIHVEMDVSNRCNLRCGWCDFAYTHGNVDIAPEFAADVLRQLAALGVKAVTFSGGGEPSCNEAFPEIVAATSHAGLHCGVYTNGVEQKPLLRALPFLDWLYISLDAYSRESYLQAKGVDAFWAVLRTLEVLREARDAGPFECALGTGYLMNGANWADAPTAIDAAEATGADYMQLRPVVGLDDYDWVIRARAMMENEAVTATDWFQVIYNPRRFEELLAYQYGAFERGYTECRGSALVPCIGATGELWVCPNMRGKRSLGNLHDDRFRALWDKRPVQMVGADCRIACRNHELNRTLEHLATPQLHEEFV